MQLYACDDQDRLVSAAAAEKYCDYRCLECGALVRLRGGLHRRHHFFHLRSSSHCRQSAKSITHLQVQWRLQGLLPVADHALEYRFPKINRVADVVWFSERIIFEVQCSPITAKELLQRNYDYGAAGYFVVWILHEQCFNQRRMTASEMVLCDRLHYFTDINKEGEGIIYDQYGLIEKGKRRKLFNPLPVEIQQIKKTYLENKEYLPKLVQQRLQHRKIYFAGDLTDRWLSDPQGILWQEINKLEGQFSLKDEIIKWTVKLFVGPYMKVFHWLLEKACGH